MKIVIIFLLAACVGSIIKRWWRRISLLPFVEYEQIEHEKHDDVYKAAGYKKYTVEDEYGKRNYWSL